MITNLRLSNFRRHADTELRFAPDAQVVLISGSNGAGKSTIIEALLFALYGESRHGRRNLDSLLRRGAEFEGMEVELSFTIGATTYRVLRRRDSKMSSAVLFANDIAITEGVGPVTAEITRVLGMDSAGFRLAVLAQQKDLDALTGLQPARRAEAVARLLRLDAITAARDTARHRFRVAREVTRALDGGPDVTAAAEEVAFAEAQLSALGDALAESNESLAVLSAELSASASIVETYRAASEAYARREGEVTSAEAEVERLVAAVAAVVVPDAPEPCGDPDELAAAEAAIEREIHDAQQVAQRVADRATRVRELAEIDEHLAELLASAEALGAVEELTAAAETATSEVDALSAERDAVDAAGTLLRDRESRLTAELERLARLCDVTDALSGECETCGQEVSDDHRHDRAVALAADADRVRAERDAVSAELSEKRARREEITAALDELSVRLRTLSGARERAAALVPQIAELERRRGVVAQIAERLPATAPDMDQLFASRADAAVATSAARAARDADAARDAALARRSDLEALLTSSRAAFDAAVVRLEASKISSDVAEEFARRVETERAFDAERQLSSDLSTQVAVAESHLDAARGRLAAAQDHVARRAEHELTAEVAHATTALLADVSERMASRVGPALSATISDMLAALSDGRFDTAKVDADYNVTVRDDDGRFHSLGDFSGGEVDLIALAVRLALAATVAERSGHGGPGFLILDECFGSQDPSRRQSILTALRNLRAAYGQIFLISHVGGLEDAADVVVELSSSVDRANLDVVVS